jgi:hypothetical protein
MQLADAWEGTNDHSLSVTSCLSGEPDKLPSGEPADMCQPDLDHAIQPPLNGEMVEPPLLRPETLHPGLPIKCAICHIASLKNGPALAARQQSPTNGNQSMTNGSTVARVSLQPARLYIH